MLLNRSENLAKKNELIHSEVGKPFCLEERQKLKGVLLTELPVTAASIDLYNLMVLNQSQTLCSIEIRPKGILIHFQANLERYSLVIPFYKLKIYKGKAEEYSFYRDHYFIKIWAGATQAEVHSFVRKLKNFKADNSFPRIEDL